MKEFFLNQFFVFLEPGEKAEEKLDAGKINVMGLGKVVNNFDLVKIVLGITASFGFCPVRRDESGFFVKH